MKISPQKLRKLIEQAGFNNAEFAREVKVSIQAIRTYTEERVAVARIKPEILRRIAEQLRVPIDELRVRENDNGPSLAVVDTGIIPEWEIDLRASQWAPVPIAALNYDDDDQRRIVNAGRFRLRVLGACMEPAYRNGAVVEFRIVRHDEPLPVGHDYAVCRSDGTATFKRLQEVTEDELVLAALNQKDHPGVLRVPRQEVSRLAVAVRLLMDVPAPGPVKVRKGRGKDGSR